jgi:hypothetical protein
MTRKAGDLIWRGYARPYGTPDGHYPEIRPGHIRHVHEDGTCDVVMEGIMPGRENKRNPGFWMTYHLDPDLMLDTPEAALAQALEAVKQCNAPDCASITEG